MYFVKMYNISGGQRLEINYIKKINGQWSEPRVPSFANPQYEENHPFFSEDGNTLYFISQRSGHGIFKVTRTSSGWSTPEELDIPIPSSLNYGWQFAIVRSGTIYLELSGGEISTLDIYKTRLINGRYSTPTRITAVNSEYAEFSPYVDPEEKYMIFVSRRPEGLGYHDLYMSFRQEDGSWSEPRNLAAPINDDFGTASPYITPCGRYFFFTAIRAGDAGYNPYWVDARALGIIEHKVFAHSDYSGDGKADLAVFDPKTRLWDVKGQFKRKYGKKGALPTPGDYNGDGKTDLAYYLPVKKLWKVKKSFSVKAFGGLNNIPVPADYDGDGITDAALFNPFTGVWRICESSKYFKETRTISFGVLGDIPVPGDYNGDGTREIAVFRPKTQEWLFENSPTIKYGKGTDLPVPADYNGDGITDIATWDQFKGKWYVYKRFKKKFGKYGDIPVPGDYDGDGKADIAIFTPDKSLWNIRKQFKTKHGKPGVTPLIKGN